MKSELESYWNSYYADQAFAAGGDPDLMLDYDNQPLTSQAQAVVMDAIGPVIGKKVLDVGCGWGYLARCVHAMGAQVTGLEQVAEIVETLKTKSPQIEWIAASILEAATFQQLGNFDIVTAVESLQYVDFKTAVETLWNRVGAGGRLVVIIPNSDCEIAQRAASRFEGRYMPVSPEKMIETAESLSGVELWRFRGMTFADDQRLQPYTVSRWFKASETPDWVGVPNRLAMVIKRAT
jgi:2-polyprenyl-3-methyl-5-hydroxy-6-metoxy-1,4-benzoquinol methylase